MARVSPENRRWAAGWRGTALLVFLAAAVAVVLLLRAPWKETSRPDDGDPLAGELAHLKMLGHALKLHADEHDGRYPATVGDIEWRQALPGMDSNNLPALVSRFHDPDGGRTLDWLYYAGHTETDPGETILVASPVAIGANKDRRMVTRVSNVTEVLSESDFQKQIGAGSEGGR